MSEIEPGLIPDMPNCEYHDQTDWWSSTQLKSWLPERYKTGGSTDALTFGTLVHEVVLEPDNLDHYEVVDAHEIAGANPKTGKPYDNPTMTARYKAHVAEVQQSGKVLVSREDWERAHAMRDAIADHETAAGLIFGTDGRNEESAFWVDGTGVQHKARFDRRIPGALVDLKTTSAKPGADSLTRACIDYGYDLSAAHYLEVAAGLGLDAGVFAHVWVAKEAPYRVTVTELDAAFVARGRVLRALALERAASRVPAYEGADGYLTLTPPRWADLKETA